MTNLDDIFLEVEFLDLAGVIIGRMTTEIVTSVSSTESYFWRGALPTGSVEGVTL